MRLDIFRKALSAPVRQRSGLSSAKDVLIFWNCAELTDEVCMGFSVLQRAAATNRRASGLIGVPVKRDTNLTDVCRKVINVPRRLRLMTSKTSIYEKEKAGPMIADCEAIT